MLIYFKGIVWAKLKKSFIHPHKSVLLFHSGNTKGDLEMECPSFCFKSEWWFILSSFKNEPMQLVHYVF